MFSKSIHLLKWDSLGGCLSFLCLVHCLILPWMAALLPITLFLDESMHVWLFFALVPAATLAAWNGYREHGQALPVTLITAGIALVGLGAFWPMSETLKTALTIAGSLLLVAGHIINGRLTLIHRIVMQQI
jgi:hypothetical protein